MAEENDEENDIIANLSESLRIILIEEANFLMIEKCPLFPQKYYRKVNLVLYHHETR